MASKFLQTYALRCGGSAITAEEANILAKYDMMDANRFHYDDVNGDTWSYIRAINPDIVIFLYQTSRAQDDDDANALLYLNNVSRWNVSRGHPMGDLNNDNPGLFLYSAGSNRLYDPAFPYSHLMDGGDNNWTDYWVEATNHDIADQTWAADGVFIDVVPFRRLHMNAMPVEYPSDALYSVAQHNFINKVAAGLNAENQKIICNTDLVNQVDFDNFVTLDGSSTPPYAMFSEGAFAVTWGPADVQFYPESSWKLQVDLMSQIHNFRLAYISHTDLNIGQSGTDNWGKPVTYWDILWYSMASYHIGKNTVDNNSYWSFCDSRSKAVWFDEYDYINLGNAIGNYQVSNIGGNNIYYREFVDGYVYVNPTKNDVSNIALPETCKQLTHTNFKNDPATISSTNTISLVSHRGTFLLKSVSPPPMITCNDPTTHQPSGCALLNWSDTNNDGVINTTNTAKIQLANGEITQEEFDFIEKAVNAGSINAICPGCYGAPPAKVAHWTMDSGDISGSILHDVSGNNNDGTIHGASQTPGIINEALDFNGTSDYVRVPHSSSIDFADEDFSISAWFKTTTANAHNYILSKNYGGAGVRWYGINILPGTPTVTCYVDDGTNNSKVNTTDSYNDGAWHHLVFVRDTTKNKLIAYIDGKWNAESTDMSGSIANNGALTIGARADLSTGRFFDDAIDDLRIYNDALSLSEVAELFKGAAISPEVTCDSPTDNHASGCDLLNWSDINNDGVIGTMGTADGQLADGLITQREHDFVYKAWEAGSINALCPGCYSAAPIEHDINIVVQVGATVTIDGKLIDATTMKRLSVILKELTK